MKSLIILLFFFILFPDHPHAQGRVFISDNGTIHLTSDAPLEVIRFHSEALKGAIDPQTNSFAFAVNLISFHGFNSEIQRTHFLENYMEQPKYPQATFKGKIIEDISFKIPGTYSVRAKGELKIHGIIKERIIKGTLVVKENSALLETAFHVPVADHGIAIPKIVNQKIAEEIAVTIRAEFVAGPKT